MIFLSHRVFPASHHPLRRTATLRVELPVGGLFGARLESQLVGGSDLLGSADTESVLVAVLNFFQRESRDFEVEKVDKDETELENSRKPS